jgi:hypothetical protein
MFRTHRIWIAFFAVLLLHAAAAVAQEASPAPASGSQQISSFEQAIERIVARENALVAEMKTHSPLVEVYIQAQGAISKSTTGGKDYYFLGRAKLDDGVSFLNLNDAKDAPQPEVKKGFFRRIFGFGFKSGNGENVVYHPNGFLEMIYLDRSSFSRQTYDFEYLRREFLGEVRCFVFDISPKKGMEVGRFSGRIWVEDQGFNIVRFNGAYQGASKENLYFHFDSWRLNVAPEKWMPALIYSEETNVTNTRRKESQQRISVKAQVRLWGYNLSRANREAEFSQVLIEAQNPVRDSSENSTDRSPVESKRLWDRQAEENVIEKLQAAALLAPAGEVDQILNTVANNLIVTNNINIDPELRTRVLLTSTLEAFTIGHTIIVSRGLIDVLPDEPSLAAVLAQQLGHIVSGHQVDGKYAFNDRLIVADNDVLRKLNFSRTDAEISEAGNKAVELLKNSPYKDQLQKAGLFFVTLNQESKELPQLIQANLGNGVVPPQEIVAAAPPLEPERKDQITALPLGSRVKLDPWSSRAELVRGKPVALISAKEKMPFEITPFMLYLTRFRDPAQQKQDAATATKSEEMARKPTPDQP